MTKTAPFRPEDNVLDAESVEAFLKDAFESGDPAVIADALGVAGRSRGMSDLARDTGLNRQALYRTLSVSGNPSLDTVLKVAHTLGLRLTVKAVPEPA